MVLSGLPAESFPHPPGNQTPLRRGGHLAVHLLLNHSSFSTTVYLAFEQTISVQVWSSSYHFFTCKQYATKMVLHLSDFTISRHMLILSKLEMCNVWRLILWCKCLSDNSMDIFLSTKVYLAWNCQELAKSCTSLLVRCEVWNSLLLVSPFKPVKAQRCRGSSGTNHRESYYIESCSHCLSGDESRDKSCECRLLCRQQSRLFQPAWIVDAWLCSSGQRCSTGFLWTKWRRRKRLCVYKTTAEMTTHKKI